MALIDGLLDNATDLLAYNRDNFFFDAKLRQEREYQEQNVRVKQFELYRQDVRDLVELTTGKKDSFLAPCAILLGVCLTMLVEGAGALENLSDSEESHHLNIVENDHEWLVWLYVISLAQAILYIILSMWLSLHASVAAHSFAVRLLTQFVRLPVPDKAKLDAARTYAADFEGQSMSDILKVPLWRKQLDRMAAVMGEKESENEQSSGHLGGARSPRRSAHVEDNSEAWLGDQKMAVMSMKHVRLYRELQSHWQAHDAYASVCFALGAYTLVQAFAYYTLTLFVVKLGLPPAALGVSLAFSAAGWLLIQLDIAMRTYVLQIGAMMLMCGPILISLSLAFYMHVHIWYHRVLVMAVFIQHWVLIVCITYVARAEQLESYRLQSEAGARRGKVAVPTRFRWVLFVDVFGWIEDPGRALVQLHPTRAPRPKKPPPGLVFAGQEDCWKLSADIHRQLLSWETAVEQHPYLLPCGVSSQVLGLRSIFMDIVQKLPRPDASNPGEVCPQSPTPLKRLTMLLAAQPQQIPIWLHIQDMFVRVEPLQLSQEAPSNAIVSFLSSVREQISVLRQRQEALAAMQAVASALVVGGRPRLPQLHEARGVSEPELASSSSSPRRRSPRRLVADGCQSIQNMRRNLEKRANRFLLDDHHDDENGIEMADMGAAVDFGQVRSPVRRAPSMAEQPFYPRFDGRAESGRAPGQVPSAVFTRASGLLVFVWFVGTLWYGWESLVILQMVHPITPGTLIKVSTNLNTAAAAGAGDGSTLRHDDFVDFLALACHASFGASVLVADRFRVWELSATSNWIPQHSSSVDRCLEKDPDFRSVGLRGLHLECPSAGRCTVILEGARQGTFLTCHVTTQRSQRTLPSVQPLSLHKTWAGEILHDQDLRRVVHDPGSEQSTAFSASWQLPQDFTWQQCCLIDDRLLALGFPKQRELKLGELWTFPKPWRDRAQ